MKWVKLHTSLHLNDAFLRVSRQARLLFYVLLEVAGAAEADGALVLGNGSAMTLAEIARHAALSERTTKAAIDELVGIGFVSLRLDAAYVIEKWAEKTGPDTSAAAERQRRKRRRDVGLSLDEWKKICARHGNRCAHCSEPGTVDTLTMDHIRPRARGGQDEPTDIQPLCRSCNASKKNRMPGNVTRDNARDVTLLEGEGEREEEGEVTARCACAEPAPAETTPEAVVDRMLVVFTNTKSPAAQNRLRPKWLGWLRLMLGDGYTLAQIWAACVVAHGDANHAPLVQSGGIWATLRRYRSANVVPFARAAGEPILASTVRRVLD